MDDCLNSEFRNVPCYLIDESTRDRYLEDGFCPLSEKEDFDLHERQWQSVLQSLSEAMSLHWMRGVGDGDFYLDSDVVPDRLLCVEVSDIRMLTPLLPQIVHCVVEEAEPPYSVDICDSWGYLKEETGAAYPHFNIFVEKNRLLVFTESLQLIERLGLRAMALRPDGTAGE